MVVMGGAVGRGGRLRGRGGFLLHSLQHFLCMTDLVCTMALSPAGNFKTFKLKICYIDEFFLSKSLN